MVCNSILEEYGKKKSLYVSFCNKVKELIEDVLRNNHIEYHSITNRVKDEDNLKKKILKKQKYTMLEEITDLAGVRIVTYYSDTVDIIAKLIEQEFEVDKDNTIDKRQAIDPEKFGYMSLHYVVKLNNNRLILSEYKNFAECKVEIQIRTILQHTWAEIEHDLGYKSKFEIPKDIRRSFSSLAGLLEIADREFLGIRNKINIYEKDVNKQIEQTLDDIHIDSVSLYKYINQGKLVKELNTYIAGVNNFIIIDGEKAKSDTIQELFSAGFSTLSDIEKGLYEYKDLVKYIADYLLHGYTETTELYNTISLYYLCLAKILSTFSRDEIESYLEYNNIGYENADFCAEICDLYTKYKKQNNKISNE